MAAPVQSPATNEGSGATVSATLSASPTNDNTILIISTAQGGTTAPAPTGWGVSSWTLDVDNAIRRGVRIYRGTTDGSSATGTVASAFGVCSVTVIEAPAGVTLDGSSTNDAQNANPATGTISPTAGADILLVFAVQGGVNTTTGPTNSFTAIRATGSHYGSGYRDVASASGTYSSGFGTGNNYDTWGAAGAAYKVVGVTFAAPAVPRSIAVSRAANY